MVITNQMAYKEIDTINPMTEKITILLDRYYSSPVQICPWRSHLATLSWKESEGQPIHIRRAKLFSGICDEIPIAIFDHELIVGSQTHYPRGVGLQLDFSSSIGFEIEEGDRRLRAEQTKGDISEDDLKIIIEDTHYWADKSPGDIMLTKIKEIMGSLFEDISVDACTRSYGKNSLTSPEADYQKILTIGLRGIINEIDKKIAVLPFTSPGAEKKYQLLQAARICLEAEIRLAKRYALLAQQMAQEETNETRRGELQTIAEVCERVPEYPPRNFQEALQSARFIHLGLYMEEGNGSGIPLGRLDQYLYPYFIADVGSGTITHQQAAILLSAFWIKVASTDAITPAGIKISGAGYLNTRVTLGGVDRNGKGACNELTYLVLHIAGILKIGIPTYLRWYSGISRELMLKAAWTNAKIGSEPAFHNDEQIIPGLVADGASLEDARNYTIEGCANPFPYGSIYSTYHWLNGPKILELVMCNGLDPRTGKQLGIATGDPLHFTCIDDWINAFMKQWEYIYDIVLKGFCIGETVKMQIYSQPFASSIIPDCLEKGLDVNAGGVRYPQFTGDIYNKVYADVADSLTAINQLVYQKHQLTIEQILDACTTNFKCDFGESIRNILLSAPKYGNDLGEPEKMYRLLNDRTGDFGRSRTGFFGYPKRDARLGGAVHSSMGRVVGALPNGRKAGIPLADGGISPSAGCDTRGPTVSLRSVAKAIDYTKNRSCVLNQKMPQSLLLTKEHLNLFVDLIESFFKDLNGYQIQWNIQNKDTFITAQKKPEEYKNLIVRVGGFSAYFVELDPILQDEIIARTEQSL